MEQIDSFRGEYRFLSNFWLINITLAGKVYPSIEHAFQALKTVNPEERESVQLASTPAEAKRLGRRVTLRGDWPQVKVDVMTGLVRLKFLPDTELASKLLATGDAELIEGNTWNDTFWGICRGKGQNHLGKILMEVRSKRR